MATVDPALLESIFDLSLDLWAIKLYWVAIATLWFYEYFLTFPDEVKYGWPRGRAKTPVFWLYLLNRYFAGAVVILTTIIYFLDGWNDGVCVKYGVFKPFEVMAGNFLAEVLLTLRVYALSRKNKAILVTAAVFMMAQWGLIIYAMTQTSHGSNHLALLLDYPADPLQELPKTDPFHLCIFILSPDTAVKVQAWFAVSIAFDGLAFLGILYYTFARHRLQWRTVPILQVMRNDGIIYFFVLFASNLLCLTTIRYARKGIKYIHLQPSSIVASIMMNRITVNLKRTAERESRVVVWSLRTFQDTQEPDYESVYGERRRSQIQLEVLRTTTTTRH